jgi:response regulator RpfG family c-di-GMP phosphodiesterase
MGSRKILCVDDDEKVLNGIERQQGDNFDITIAVGPTEALQIIESEGPFAVVISDMKMPDMNGVALLKKVREISPNTVRMILTGFAELTSTIEAINDGHIFRFLAKPCSESDLAASFESGLNQYALIEAERELVEGTLRGSVKVLSDVLSLVNPLAFGQATRVKSTVDGILKHVDVENRWQLEIAAMLSALGCVTLPNELLKKKLNGTLLTYDEKEILNGHPSVSGDLLRAIPRLDIVADIIALHQTKSSDPRLNDSPVRRQSRILKLALDFDLVELNAESAMHALNHFKDQGGEYGDDLIDALSQFVQNERHVQFVNVMIHELVDGMVLAEDIKNSSNGLLLMSKGQELTRSARRLLENFSKNKSIHEPLKVVVANAKLEPTSA